MTPSPLARWYQDHGRHDLPWRLTREPWAVLVSEVMLQQTSVGRVQGRWEEFLSRWPDPAAFAAADRADVLRAWQGLGYPRRAVALQQTAAIVAEVGWPGSETGLRALPGVGAYTARALLCFSWDASIVPADVNVRRVASRAWFGVEEAPSGEVNAGVARRRGTTTMRDHVFALFDVGAAVCRSRQVHCNECPLAARCRSRVRLRDGVPARPRRQAAYAGSLRQLRGAVLREVLTAPSDSRGTTPIPAARDLERRLHSLATAHPPGTVALVLAALTREGLIG